MDGCLTIMYNHGHPHGLADHRRGLLRWNQNFISVHGMLKDTTDKIAVHEQPTNQCIRSTDSALTVVRCSPTCCKMNFPQV